jgi:alpha-tubulin suppressor-like RCC1 family protein
MIGAGFRHSLALTNDGTVYMWGGSIARDAGDDVRVLANKEIIKVAGLPKIKTIIGGKDYSLAIAEDGRLFGWGSNVYHILSSGSEKMINTPVEIKLPFTPSTIGAGADFIVATE